MTVTDPSVTQPSYIESVAISSGTKMAKLVIDLATAAVTSIDFTYEIASTEPGITQVEKKNFRVVI